jgi:hypothetical protein
MYFVRRSILKLLAGVSWLKFVRKVSTVFRFRLSLIFGIIMGTSPNAIYPFIKVALGGLNIFFGSLFPELCHSIPKVSEEATSLPQERLCHYGKARISHVIGREAKY